jgi:hypothetical protein
MRSEAGKVESEKCGVATHHFSLAPSLPFLPFTHSPPPLFPGDSPALLQLISIPQLMGFFLSAVEI